MPNEFKVKNGLVVDQGGANITGSSNISGSLGILSSGSSVFTVDGTSGRLFSVDDSLSGSLFSVNTAAGLPIMEAFSDNTVRIGQYGQKALFVSQSNVGFGKEASLGAKVDVSGSVLVTGSLSVTSGITGSLFGTASWANNAVTSSYTLTASVVTGTVDSASYAFTASSAISASQAQTASYVLNAISSSYAFTASSAVNSTNALTASSADNFLVRQALTASNALITGTITAQTLVVSTVSSSVVYSSGSNVFGNSLTNTQVFTGSVRITGSLSTIGTNTLIGNTSLTGSVAITGSTTQTGNNTLIGNTVLSGSISVSGSQNFRGTNTITGSVNISGSTVQIGNNTLLGDTTLTGSIIISSSFPVGSTSSSVKIYGDTTMTGFLKFEPYSTNIDTTISASYVFVSGSTNDLYFSQNSEGYSNVTRLRWIEGNLYTGLLHGGLITTQSSTVYQVSSGSGVIVTMNASIATDPYPTTQLIEWPTLSASIAPLSASFDQSFIAIQQSGNTGIIYAQGTPYDNGQFNTLIPIGNVIHQNRSTINATATYPSVAYAYKQRSSDFIRAFGALKLSGLNTIVSGSSTGSIAITSGTAFSEGRNYTTDPNNPSYVIDTGQPTSKIFRYYQSGSGWVYLTNGGAGFATIDPTQYSNNGVLTPVPGVGINREWSIQRVFYFPAGATKGIYVYYGNATYPSQTDAIANIPYEDFVEAPNTAGGAVLSSYLVVRNNADFTVADSYNIEPAGLFRNVGGSGGGGSAVTTRLVDLSDVSITSPTNLQPLAYNDTTLKWENVSAISSSISGNAATATSASYATTASYALSTPPTYIDNFVTVGLPGSNTQFNSIKTAVDSITDASANNTYTVKVYPGLYVEDTITLKSWIAIKGDSSTSTVVSASNSNASVFVMADQSMVIDMQIQGSTAASASAIYYSSPTTPQTNAIAYAENIRFGTNFTNASCIGSGSGNCILQCSNVKYGGSTDASLKSFDIGFRVSGSGGSIGRMQLRNVTSTNGGVAGTDNNQIFALADAPGCTFIVNGCLLTRATGAARGTGFKVYNGGSLRLTAVNFQRWINGIWAPQTGSAPSIDAIALNFENCTTDVLVEHTGSIGKVSGTDNFLKTQIALTAPLYEVGQDPRRITVGTKGADFTSISASVAWISGSDANNRYVIEVGPGQFTEKTIDLTGKPYVSIVGSNIQTTQVFPSSSNQHIFKMGINNELSFLSLANAGPGYSGIYVDNVGDFAQVHKVSIYDCDRGITVLANSNDTQFYGEYVDINGTFTYGTFISSSNGASVSTTVENYYLFPSASATIGNFVTGPSSSLSLYTAKFLGDGTANSTAVKLENGAQLEGAAIDVQDWDYGYVVPNTGIGPNFRVVGSMIHDSTTYDFDIQNVTTRGRYQGVSDHSKINNLSQDFYWNFLDDVDGENDITRKLSVTFADGTHTDATTLIFKGSPMGVMQGGEITISGSLTINTAAGFGYLENSINPDIYQRVDWVNSTLALSPNTNNYIYLNDNDILSAANSAPDSTQNIILGRVVTNATGIEFIDQSPYDGTHTTNKLSKFNRDALGPVFDNGSIVSANTGSAFKLDVTAGSYFFSENNFTPAGTSSVNFTQYYRSGSGWNRSLTNTVVSNLFDSGSNVLSPLASASYTKHTLYLVGEGVDEEYFLVIGQTQYASLVEAEGAGIPTPPTYFNDGVVSLASVYVRSGSADIVEIQDIRPIIGFRAAGVNASATHGNLLGLGADDHLQYLLVNGNRQMSGNLGLGGNNIYNANQITASVVLAPSITGSLFGTASWAQNAVTASYVLNAVSASFTFTASSARSASLSISASYAFTASSAISSSYAYTASSAISAFTASSSVSSSLAISASYAFAASSAISSSFATTAITSSFPITVIGTTLRSVSPAGGVSGSTTNSIFFGQNAGNDATSAQYSNFFGRNAGFSSSLAYESNFFGNNAGSGSAGARNSNFFGTSAGSNAINAWSSNFFGSTAGFSASRAFNSNFFGAGTGYEATNAAESNFIGVSAGSNATSASFSNFFGTLAGSRASSASNSNFLGQSAGNRAASASYCTLIGTSVGYNTAFQDGGFGISSNNIIIGTNITLPDTTKDSINLGAIIFATGSYSNFLTDPFSGSVTTGRVGINKVSPIYTLDVSGSGNYSNGLTVTGSLIAPNITGSLFGTASWARNAVTSSYIVNAISASYAFTASSAVSAFTASSAVNSTNALTASSADNFVVRQSITASNALINGTITAQTLVVQTITSSTDFVTGSTRFGSTTANTHTFTGSVSISGSLSVIGRSTITDLTGSLFGTASWATNFITSSVTSASYAFTASSAISSSFSGNTISSSYAFTASSAISSSFASNSISASYAFTASSAISAFTASSARSASLAISASYAFTASSAVSAFTASSAVSASLSISASYAFTASSAVSTSYALTASYVNTLNQSLVITGSLTVGLLVTGSSENTIIIGPPQSGGAGEGGQMLLAAAGGIYTSASMLDNYQNRIRVLRGTNTGSDAEIASFNMHTGQMVMNKYTGSTTFPGTAAANLAVDTFGNVITTNPGTVTSASFASTASYVNPLNQNVIITGSLTVISGGITSSLFGTASWALNFITSSVTSASYAFTASSAISSSYAFAASSAISAFTASSSVSSSQAISASYAFTASSAISAFTASSARSASLAISASYAFTASSAISSSFAGNTISASYAFTASSAISSSFAGNTISSSYAFTASSAISSSYAFTASSAISAFTASSAVSSSQAISASYAFTASSAISSFTASSAVNSTNALTASSADNFVVRQSITASNALINGTITAQTLVVQTITSSTDFVTGSTRFGSQLSNTHVFTGSVSITGSLTVNGYTAVTSDMTGSMSVATASFAVSASYAPNIYNSDGALTSNRIVSGGAYTLALNTKLNLGGTITESFSRQVPYYWTSGILYTAANIGLYYENINSTSSSYAIIGSENAILQKNTGTSSVSAVGDFSNINLSGTELSSPIFGIGGRFHINRGSDPSDISTNASNYARGVESYLQIWKNSTTPPLTQDATHFYGWSQIINGTITNKYGVQILDLVGRTSITLPTTITNYYGFYNQVDVGWSSGLGGTVTNYYGLFIDPLVRATGTITNRWGVYITDPLMNNYLNGNLSLGTNETGSFKLLVKGSTKFSGSVEVTGSLNAPSITGSLFGTASWAQNTQTASSADNFIVRQSLTASAALISGSGTQRVTIVGSGSAQPIFTVLGSQGELFSITDSLSGSLFSVNDISGLPIMEVFSDSTTLMGSYSAPMLITTYKTGSVSVGANIIYSLPTASYDAVFLEYSIKSGSNARAGNFAAIWSGSAVNFMDNSTVDFGNTAGFVIGAQITGGNMVVTGSATTTGWTVKTIIRSI